jgi:hypothetical protein
MSEGAMKRKEAREDDRKERGEREEPHFWPTLLPK